ncbi:hypothetical protein BO71DRAFT_105565 [Aspergillus ellipticus CBS 707.79]|uniref:BTB domain-containing protein n=1 Tax=Aspergillus ellipticus CBS 707.79 TaxID=1448320 RepID=A0A319CWW4_9EURO|nr:hypothetical protein BO71DRAFT_105565 [Aspergillus ellipticus CBS 707.79]
MSAERIPRVEMTHPNWSVFLEDDDMLSVADSDECEPSGSDSTDSSTEDQVAGVELLENADEDYVHIVARDGDVKITVVPDRPTTMLVSSEVLRLSSEYFADILGPDTPEGERLEQGHTVDLLIGYYNPAAMLLIMRAAHGLYIQVPAENLPLELLLDIAAIVDSYSMYHVVWSFIINWLRTVERRAPGISSRELVDWTLVVLGVFHSPCDFLLATRSLVMEEAHTCRPNTPLGPSALYKAIEEGRQTAMARLRKAIREHIKLLNMSPHPAGEGTCPCDLRGDWKLLLRWARYPKRNRLSPALLVEMIRRRVISYQTSDTMSMSCGKHHDVILRATAGIERNYKGVGIAKFVWEQGPNYQPEWTFSRPHFNFAEVGWPVQWQGLREPTHADHEWWVTKSVHPTAWVPVSDDE